MLSEEELKNIVKEKYSQVAKTNLSCCGSKKSSCCETEETKFTIIGDEYKEIEGHVDEADLNLGCGVPTKFAGLKSGQVVVDLGCGAGNDVFIARRVIGEYGKVIGIDFTEEMIQKAKANNLKLGYKNVEFILSDIENTSLEDNSVDVVISNCVLNLLPDKYKAYKEIFRILKSGGHFCVSDIMVMGNIPDVLRKDVELYAACITGAINLNEYVEIINRVGFVNTEIKQLKKIDIPDNVLLKNFPTPESLAELYKSFQGIYSATIVGFKP
ncbi:MAG: arsenite methyltransferase [Ignavibacteria bacterium]|nr:arsenite methyltransferase [Ignavibacteria bacterium]